MSRKAKWVFNILIAVLVLTVAVISYLVVSGRVKIGAAGETESCLQVANQSELTGEAGGFVTVKVGRLKSCALKTNLYGLIESADPTLAVIESVSPATDLASAGAQYEANGLLIRLRLSSNSATTAPKLNIRLAEKPSVAPYVVTLNTVTTDPATVKVAPNWLAAINSGTVEADISGGTAPYKYCDTTYKLPTGQGGWSDSAATDTTCKTVVSNPYATVTVDGAKLKIAGKDKLAVVQGKVVDSVGKEVLARFSNYPQMNETKAPASEVEVGKDVDINFSNGLAIGTEGIGNVGLQKIVSDGAGNDVYSFRGLKTGTAKVTIIGQPIGTETGEAFWKDTPVTTQTVTVSNGCDAATSAYNFVPSAWNLKAMPHLTAQSASISKLIGVDASSLNTWGYRGLGKPYQKTDTFNSGEGYWLNSSASESLCLEKSGIATSKKQVKLPYKGLNIVVNPNVSKTLKLSDIKIALDSGKQYTLPEALNAKEDVGGKQYSVVKMIAFWVPEGKTNVKGTYNIYDVYVNQAAYPNYRADDYSIKVHDIGELPKTLGPLEGVWVATRSTSDVTVSY